MIIYNFNNHQDFLLTYVETQRSQNKSWSIGKWAKEMEMSSTATLTNILNGKRLPGKKLKESFKSYFNFSSCEAEYFDDLIRLSKVQEDPKLSLSLIEKLKKSSPHQEFAKLNWETFKAISSWEYYVIREMVRLDSFQEDPEWIQLQLKYDTSKEKIEEVINHLLELNLLKRNSKNQLEVTSSIIKTSEDLSNEAIKIFHEGMILKGRESLRKTVVDERDISARTLNIKKEDLPQIKQLIREFRDNLSLYFEQSSESADTYQINIQLFPLTDIRRQHEKQSNLH